MPIVKGYSKTSISKNIKAERMAGRSHKQSVAIALSVAKKAKQNVTKKKRT